VTSLGVFDRFGPEVIFSRNRGLETHLRESLAGAGWDPVLLHEDRRSTIVRIPLGALEPAAVVRGLSEKRVVASQRDGALRVSVHLYNDEEDVPARHRPCLGKPATGPLQLGSQGGRGG
jgi:selenocysteine lyase/cysteine desulfurase